MRQQRDRRAWVCPAEYLRSSPPPENLGTATAMSRVIGVGYVAILAGPASIGWLADRVTLNTAFILPLCVALACAAMAPAVKPYPPPTPPLSVE